MPKEKMRVYEIERFSLDALVEKERPIPSLGEKEVLIKVHAVSLNYRDYLVLIGQYNPRQKLPLVPCSDMAGEIVEIGKKVEKFQVGDRVFLPMAPYWYGGSPKREMIRKTLGSPLDGTLREYMVAEENSLVKIPDFLSYEEASTLPCAALTAWNALVKGGALPGERILIQGTGGVSLFALQFANAFSLDIYAITGKEEGEKIFLEEGVEKSHILNYKKEPRWGRKIRHLTPQKEGVHLIVEVGGAKTFNESLEAISIGGRIAQIGILSGKEEAISFLPIIMKEVKIFGIVVGSKEDLEKMLLMIEKRKLRPKIYKVFPWEKVKDAFSLLSSGKHWGKMVIQVP